MNQTTTNDITSISNLEEVKDPKKRRRIYLLLVPVIILLVFMAGLVASIFLVQRKADIKSEAYNVTNLNPPQAPGESDVVIDNSYVFASPLKAKSQGEYIRITVFALDQFGEGVVGKPVVLGVYPGLEIQELQAVTNDIGQAIFHISSQEVKTYLIEPSIEGTSLGKRVTVTFE